VAKHLRRPQALPGRRRGERAGRHAAQVGQPGSRLIRLALLVVLLLAIAVSDGWGPGPFVTRDGSRLMLGGSTFRFTGMNVWNAAAGAAGNRYCGDPTDLNQAAPAFGSGVQVVRVWFFQRLATTPDGRRDWSAFDATLKAAREKGLRVVAVLGNQWADCEGYDSAAAGYKNEAWYSGGYRAVRPAGLPATYRDWVREIVTRYRNDPTVMLWQMVNEPEDAESQQGTCGSNAAKDLRSFASDVGGLIKHLDHHHLVSVGTAGSGQCGTSRSEYQSLYALPTEDVLEYHDYALEPIPGDQWNGLAVRLQQAKALDKPLLIGEVGVVADQAGGLSGRAALVHRKLDAQFGAGVGGVLLWAWRAQSSGGSDEHGYSIGPRDPVLVPLAAVARQIGARPPNASG
jgi:mannan endo-1,4-beta-mannosidase